MKKIIYLLLILLPFLTLSQNSFQPLDETNWELLNKEDHTKHMLVGQFSTWVPALFITYWGEEPLSIKRGLKYAATVSLLLTLGKELLWDSALGLGQPSYSDLMYGIIGTITGALFSYGVYKFERWQADNKQLKL